MCAVYKRCSHEISEAMLFGLQVKPLPYESSFSIVSLFSWRNTLRKQQISEQLGLRYGSKNSSFLGHHFKSSSILRGLSGHSFPLPIEMLIRECLGSSAEVWFDADLKICPICFELGYHSVWHQFKLLEMCPIHACPLSKRCVSCGVFLGKYSLEIDRAYKCKQCKNPISGAVADISSCMEFREQGSGLKKLFFPFELWLREANRLLKPLCALVELNPQHGQMWNSWCKSEDLLLSFGYQLCPPPSTCASPPYSSLHIRGCDFLSSPPLSNGETKYSYPEPGRDNEIYRVVLQDINEWIAGVAPQTTSEYRIAIGFKNHVTSSITDIRVAAYGMFRFMLEAIDADHWDKPEQYACLKSKLAIRLPRLAFEIPDRVFRLLFLEIYSTILILLDRAPKGRPVDMMALQLSTQKMIAFGWHAEGEVMYCYSICPEHQMLRSLSDSMWRPTFDISLD